jgi:hypothetical protein
MGRIGIAVLVFSCVALAGSAHAACGGGGWKSSPSNSSSVVVQSKASTPATQSVQSVVVESDLYTYTPSHPLDTTRLDSAAPQLNLTEEQKTKIAQAKQAIKQEIESLLKNKAKTERAFDECKGACDAERVPMRAAFAAEFHYSPGTQLDTQLHTILDAKQLEIYEHQKEVSTTK